MAHDRAVPEAGWDLASLTELFAEEPAELGEIALSVADGTDVLRITLRDRGDLDVLMAASGEQVLCSVVLAPADSIPRREMFERTLLSAHKLIPLSTFGLTVLDGEDWYELFGALSARSSARALVEEVAVLGANAVDAAEWIDEWIASGGNSEGADR